MSVWIQIRTDKTSVLFCVQTVCKGYQQKTKSLLAGKGLKGNLMNSHTWNLESLNIDVLSEILYLFAACVDVPVNNISVISGHFLVFLG